jgi:translation initiation factor IF-3
MYTTTALLRSNFKYSIQNSKFCISTRLFIQPAASQPGFDRTKRQPVTPPPPINEFIKVSPVRLIVPGNSTGEEVMAGIFPVGEALKMAETMEMDLVLINDKAEPPVCKIIDYGKFKYSVEKKKKENLKKQVKVDIKEVKMSYKIDQHDFDVRLRACQKFLEDGDRV